MYLYSCGIYFIVMSGEVGGKKKFSFVEVLQLIFRGVWKKFPCFVVGFCFLAVVVGVLFTIAPRLLQQIVDLLVAGRGWGREFLVLTGLYGACLFLGHVCKFALQELSFYVATQVEDFWRYTGLQHYYNLYFAWHDKHDSGEVGSRIDRGGSALFVILHELLGHNLGVSFITLVFVLVYTFWLFPWIGVLLFVPIPVYVLVTFVISQKIAVKQAHLNMLDQRANRALYDGFANVRAVKAFGQEVGETQNYARKWSAYHSYEYGVERLWFTQDFIQTLIEIVMRTLVLGYGVYATVAGIITVGEVLLLMSYQQMTFAPLQQLNALFTRLRRNAKRASRLFEIVSEPDLLQDSPHAKNMGALQEELLLKHVFFEYSEKVAALHDISLRIPAGTTTALVGRSGAGKSTLALLLMRFYDPEQGMILYDGVSLQEIKRDSLRRQVAFIPQDTSLFNRTIRENIAYGRPRVSLKEIMACAKLARAHDFVVRTPKGYNSVIGERGVKLSGGQRQRIAIARALLMNPSVLIMDESTSHLDSETEKAISASIRALHHKTTQIIIAHRLSTILHADQIVLMDKGRVVAVGKHKDLLKHPLYNRLYRLQFHQNE